MSEGFQISIGVMIAGVGIGFFIKNMLGFYEELTLIDASQNIGILEGGLITAIGFSAVCLEKLRELRRRMEILENTVAAEQTEGSENE